VNAAPVNLPCHVHANEALFIEPASVAVAAAVAAARFWKRLDKKKGVEKEVPH
jgi:hypothetical protein